jgi:transposase-like protein
MSRIPRRRHVHLGERLDAIARIRLGGATPQQVALELNVDTADVLRWMKIHAEERNMTLDEVRVPADVLRLSRRAERLVELIATADLTIRVLNRMLAEAVSGKQPQRAS